MNSHFLYLILKEQQVIPWPGISWWYLGDAVKSSIGMTSGGAFFYRVSKCGPWWRSGRGIFT
jgi:hypothetical protein